MSLCLRPDDTAMALDPKPQLQLLPANSMAQRKVSASMKRVAAVASGNRHSV